eukprot:gene12980-15342_t
MFPSRHAADFDGHRRISVRIECAKTRSRTENQAELHEQVVVIIRKMEHEQVMVIIRKMEHEQVMVVMRKMKHAQVVVIIRKMEQEQIVVITRKMEREQVVVIIRKTEYGMRQREADLKKGARTFIFVKQFYELICVKLEAEIVFEGLGAEKNARILLERGELAAAKMLVQLRTKLA